MKTGKFNLKWNLLILLVLPFIIISCIDKYALEEKELSIQLSKDPLQLGKKLYAPTPQPEKYFDDLIHPCIRFIPEGFAGHQWWMVATPYRGGDAKIENPILYYGVSTNGLPPMKWEACCVIEETPLSGYNSDPNLHFEENRLWVFWRENRTPDCILLGYERATFGVYTLDAINFSKKKCFAGVKSIAVDNQMCPTILNFNGKLRLYGVKHQFTPNRIPLGLTIWDLKDNNLMNNSFTITKDVLPVYREGFDLWHTDFFVHNNHLFCVATPEIANEVLLGVSSDGENFSFWDKPLISSKNTGRNYFYKASAMVKDGVFYLWYPVAEEKVIPRTSRIWMSEIDFEKLLLSLNSQFSSTPVYSEN